jgi:FMN phosphatase YigB (HAD superfamily)
MATGATTEEIWLHRRTPHVQNIVFDMGGVLLDFNGPLFSRASSPQTRRTPQHSTRRSSRVPRGRCSTQAPLARDTIERMAQARLPERLWPNLHECMLHWHEHLPVIAETNALVERLHAAGYGCYVLSNAGTRFMETEGPHSLLPPYGRLGGLGVRAHHETRSSNLPGALRDDYGLDPASCLFVDDNADNVAGARVAGMQAHQFTSAQELEGYLKELGLRF